MSITIAIIYTLVGGALCTTHHMVYGANHVPMGTRVTKGGYMAFNHLEL